MKINEQSPTQWRMPREVTEKSSYLNRTGSVFYIDGHCENFLGDYQTLDAAVQASSKTV